jgi:membrane protein implicated in regulation of membrane protease activity
VIAGYQPDFWHWWILGLGLIILETVLPGTFFLWMGVAALVLGVVTWLAPALGWELQLMLFAALSLLSIVAWRLWRRRVPDDADGSTLNRRGQQYVGRVFVLETPIENGFGKVRLGDGHWRVRGDDQAAGTRVRVVAVDGVLLVVEPAD